MDISQGSLWQRILRPLKIVSLAPVALLLACSLPSETMTEGAAAASKPMDEGEILKVVETLNEGEIRQARLAQESATTPAARQAAERIIRDHTMLNERLAQIAEAEGLQLRESPLSNGIKAQAEEIEQDLAQLSGQEFDCSYLQKQAELHQIALETVRTDLLPQAENEAVQELLEASRPALDSHQEAAELGIAGIPDCPLPDEG